MVIENRDFSPVGDKRPVRQLHRDILIIIKDRDFLHLQSSDYSGEPTPRIRMSSLPKLRPSNMPMKALGAFPSPSTMSSLYLIAPALMLGPMSRRKSG